MSVPYFLDNPESNNGIIRQKIFPVFRGISAFLLNDNMTDYKLIKNNFNDNTEKIVEFEKFLKEPELIQAAQIGDLSFVTQIYHDLIVECISYLGMSEYLELTPDLLKINWSLNTFMKNDKFSVEKLMQEIFKNYKTLVISRPVFATFFLPVFEQGLLSNPPVIQNNENSEYFKYLSYLDPTSLSAIFTREEFSKFDDNRLSLALSYAFYYCLKDIFSTCYLQVTLPTPPISPPMNQLGLNILNEITLDLKNLPTRILNPTELPVLLDELNTAIDTQTILTTLTAPPNFELFRNLKSSAEELKGKLKNINNYINNNDNIPVFMKD